MSKLWEQGWQLDEAIETFETKDDLSLDQKLLLYDVYCSLAHVKTLNKIGILSGSELDSAKEGLLEVLNLAKGGKFEVKYGDEDVHTKIENFITENYGEVGKKIHTGRSRNDQVLTDIRLYTKDKLLQIWEAVISLAEAFNKFAKKYEFLPMPGYTHMQKAMPSSVGLWSAAFAEALLDDLKLLKTAFSINDCSPLGSAASYGVPLKIDREYSAALLGFADLQKNSLYCQNSRGKVESEVISALNTILFDINKFASDVMLFTTAEFGYFETDKKLCSGSSIMPQKKNVDVAELLRSKVHIGVGNYVEVMSLSSNLVSGYNRDLQDSKKPLLESLEVTLDSIKVAEILLSGIKPNEEKMKSGLVPEIFATHIALDAVAEDVPFRDAYKMVGMNASDYEMVGDSKGILKKSTHTGGTGNLMLSSYSAQIKNEKELLNEQKNLFASAIESLVKG